ncbi:MAG TPA: COX15/CtaA family protein [Candidatus Kapabacteria bacterium]|nr:COX15/CtaA family protein [Candidatus Kapabacteria bacterium]
MKYNKYLHWFSVFTVCFTFLLIIAGGMVTSTSSGLSVPDWPNTYGQFMFSFPFKNMVGGIFYEHGHRMIASFVGFLTVILAVWIWRAEKRSWVRKLGFASLGTVIAQGILGGLTVLFFLPTAISTGHALIAQTFFCLVIMIAYVNSKEGLHEYEKTGDSASPGLRRLCTMAAGMVFLQLLIGAWMRHSEAGLAIPDFPFAYGKLLPPMTDGDLAQANLMRLHLNLPPVTLSQIWIHFAHRIGAVLVTVLLMWMATRIFSQYRKEKKFLLPAIVLVLLLGMQITLGALTVLSGKNPYIATAHVATGALILGITLLTTLRSYHLVAPKEQTASNVSFSSRHATV